jgi:hypothetical protein
MVRLSSMRSIGRRQVLWPLLWAHHVWTSAVVDDGAVRFNLRLLATLTAVFSAPDVVQGLGSVAHASSAGARYYGAYVLALATLELLGAGLLALRRRAGRWCIFVAAAGFFVEAALGLSGFERGVLAAAFFVACVPAEVWVIWFLSHPRVRAYLDAAGAHGS